MPKFEKVVFLKYIFCTIIFLSFFKCSKEETSSKQDDLTTQDEIFALEDTLKLISKDTLRIPVVHHISRTSNRVNTTIALDRVDKVMEDINHNFKPAKIQFVTKAITFINNTKWNDSFVKQDDFIDSKVLTPFEDDTALNVFYFNTLLNRNNGQITGDLGATALFPDEGNNIKLSASAFELENTATITHEIGHYLGLYHTDEDFTDNQGRLELVDGSNCSEAGDKICDTAASPDLNDTNIDEPTCNYIGTETDANGETYKPDTFNFMTQWAGSDPNGLLCRRRFSQGQIEKMIQVLNNERSYLIIRE